MEQNKNKLYTGSPIIEAKFTSPIYEAKLTSPVCIPKLFGVTNIKEDPKEELKKQK